MSKEFLKMQKSAGLITESEYKEKMSEANMMDKHLEQEVYMDMLNTLFDALGNGANAYDDSTWTDKEKELAQNIYNVLERTGFNIY
jgi:hypothetical protein